MKPADCAEWRNYHSHLHVDFGGWLKSLEPAAYDDFVAATEDCLSRVELESAKRISDRMFSGELSKPFAFSAHPAAVRLHGEKKIEARAEIFSTIDRYRREAEQDPMQPTLGAEYRKMLINAP